MNLFWKKRIYLDYAAATPVDPSVLRAMKPYFSEDFGNPSSLHKEGREAKTAVKNARQRIAEALEVRPEELFFTSGGTESNNLAVQGFFRSKDLGGLHAICSEIEHSSVRAVFTDLSARGLEISFLKVNNEGRVDTAELKSLLRPNTVFVSVMLVNNEIGTIEPLKEISQTLRHYSREKGSRIVFHTDAVQAPLYLDVRPEKLGVDLMTFDGAKIYGPKGSGLLYKRSGIEIKPLFFGGSQEKGFRPGTLNVPGVVGFTEAFLKALKEREIETKRLAAMRDVFIASVLGAIKDSRLNGSRSERIANNINIFLPGLESEYSVIKLDELGFAVSSQSACLLDSPVGSYVVSAVSGGKAPNGSSLRITLGKNTTKRELSLLLKALERLMSLRIAF